MIVTSPHMLYLSRTATFTYDLGFELLCRLFWCRHVLFGASQFSAFCLQFLHDAAGIVTTGVQQQPLCSATRYRNTT